MKLLALDSATELCSVALWIDGACDSREDARPRGAAALMLGLVEELLSAAALSLRQLDAIAFGRGPGGFTGVRLTVALAQGLGFAAGLPLVPVSDIRALAQRALAQPGAPPRALICQDARMAQVYWGCFERGGADDMSACRAVADEAVSNPADVHLPADWLRHAFCGAGSGFEAYSELAHGLKAAPALLWGQLRPRALEIAQLAAADGLSAACAPEAAQAVYLRNEVATQPGQN